MKVYIVYGEYGQIVAVCRDISKAIKIVNEGNKKVDENAKETEEYMDYSDIPNYFFFDEWEVV